MDPTHDSNWLPRHGKEPFAVDLEAMSYVVFVRPECEGDARERRPVRFVMPRDQRRANAQ